MASITTPRKITPCLWFDTQADEAAAFYTGIFRDSRLGRTTHYGENAPMPKGTVLTVEFALEGQSFLALNGGPTYTINPAISFIVNCDSQDEVDYHWENLLDGGAPMACGWLTDKFGVSWQIVPTAIWDMITDPDPAKVQRYMDAMMQMIKLDLAKLQAAYDG